ncbi:hypothetical protein EYB53_024055 [Candidatus Chloroploca sp. M-50]|uniref:Uncharacterized protein n=1 Tax=Candidatus Chloroploca mongolica TaxID=2528176 RepID=A0ABS4DH99_9CHLR|nr:hypothetical protein [Candidatus Chloroploca mongolica]MBP1468806.1 hypothetical protein [Candidatus Chloroploca mongolica]
MDPHQQLRQVCAEAIRRVAQAEQQAMQRRAAASQQCQADLDAAKQQYERNRQRADTIIKDIRALVQKGEHVLGDLGLEALPPAVMPTPVPTTRPDELVTLLAKQQHETRAALTSLETTAKDLVIERTKWWKFW